MSLFVSTSLSTKLVIALPAPLGIEQLRHQIGDRHFAAFPQHGRVLCSEVFTAERGASDAGYRLTGDACLATLLAPDRIFLQATVM